MKMLMFNVPQILKDEGYIFKVLYQKHIHAESVFCTKKVTQRILEIISP